MNKQSAIELANELANEAETEGMSNLYHILQADNQDIWSVQESIEVEGELHPLRAWISPEISFSLIT